MTPNANTETLIRRAMVATIDFTTPVRRKRLRPPTVPPYRRAGTCFAGWERPEVKHFLTYMVTRIGVTDTAVALSVSLSTVRRWLSPNDSSRTEE